MHWLSNNQQVNSVIGRLIGLCQQKSAQGYLTHLSTWSKMTVDDNITLGEVIYTTVKPIFKIYLIIGMGFYLARKNILTVETSKNISTIAIRVLIPCLTFQKIVTNITNRLIHEIATIVIIGYFMMFSQALLVFSVGVMAGCPKNWWGGLILCGLLPNISDIPIAYLQTLETASVFSNVDLGVSYVMIYMGLQLLLQFTFGSYKLIEHDFKVDLGMALEEELDGGAEQAQDIEAMAESPDILYPASVRESSASTHVDGQKSTRSEDSVKNPPVNHNNMDIELDSIDSHATHHTLDLSRISRAGTNLLRNITNISNKSELSRHASRNNALLEIQKNPQTGTTPEDMNDIVKVYSKYETLVEDQDICSMVNNIQRSKQQEKVDVFTKIRQTLESIKWKQVFWAMVDVWKDSIKQPASVVLVISVTVAMIPWVQALFVSSPQVTLPSAPDKQPPLSFIMDFAGYIGAAQVPFGLLMLGGTIGRLHIKNLPRSLWRVPLAVTILRLFVFPVIGCAFNSKINRDGLFYGQAILYFLSNINFCLPPATSLLYLTAYYTPADGRDHIQMDMLALVYIFHYIFLIVCLPFTATYTIKVSLGY